MPKIGALMIYLFWGPDIFSIQVAINKILAKESEADTITLKEADLTTFNREVLTTSFFDNKKTVLAYDFLSKIIRDKNESTLKEILGKVAPETNIVFIENNEIKGVLKKYFLEKATVKQFLKLPARDLVGYVRDRATDLGIEISPLAAERFSTYVGPDFWQIEEELKKLSLYKKDDTLDQTIDVADVDELVHSSFEANIFELMDAISQKNRSRAITLLDSFLDSGQNEIYILTMIARQFRNIAMAKAEPHITETSLAKRAGIHPFVAKKSILQARNFTMEEVAEIYSRIAKADLALKSGHNTKQVLQSVILN
jgi:DNA polymerase-3 subunit delta